MRYVVFLMRGGAVPYRQIIDINYPGTYLFDSLSMTLFGAGARGLRLYDGFLLLSIAAACLAVAGRRRPFAGAFAGLLFALVHLQDGIAQQGQRDLVLTALLLWGFYAYRCVLEDQASFLPSLLFGLLFGLSFTVKPVLLPVVAFLLLFGVLRRTPFRSPAVLGAAALGLAVPGLLMVGWLHNQAALGSFVSISRSLLPLHAALGRRSVLFLLSHSASPIGALVACWVVLLVVLRDEKGRRWLLLAGLLVGSLAAYLLQGKGYPYQRYPFLAVLLLAIGLTVDRALVSTPPVQPLAVVTCLVSCGFGVWFGWKATTYRGSTPVQTALALQLGRYGSPAQLAGEVQCLDTFGGCVNTLYNLGIPQSTGFLYDCYLFTGESAARVAYRERFWTAFQGARPRLLIITSQNCFADLDRGYGRVATWPALARDLQAHYHEVDTWTPVDPVLWFSRKQMPSGFKLLLRNESTDEPSNDPR